MISSVIGLLIGTLMLDLIDALILKKITLLVILLASLVSLTKNKKFFAHQYLVWVGGFFSGANSFYRHQRAINCFHSMLPLKKGTDTEYHAFLFI